MPMRHKTKYRIHPLDLQTREPIFLIYTLYVYQRKEISAKEIYYVIFAADEINKC